jgi:hypothetical protein
MVLLSQLIRTAAVTGRADSVHAWFAGRQGGRWVEQTVRGAMPKPRRADPAATLSRLAELRATGVITDQEMKTLRARMRV